jgi:hypothetical protein
MTLSDDEVERFYAIWKPLLLFVNRRLKLVPEMYDADPDDSWDIRKVRILRDAMWADDSLRAAYIAENPAGLSAADLAMVESWKYRRAGKFFILRHLKSHSVLIGEDSTVYAVLGLMSPLSEFTEFLPSYVETVLIPFEDRIIYDSLMVPYNISFGRGIRGELEHTYADAKEREAVVTSLLPSSGAVSPDSLRSSNAKVLTAFRTHLFGSGLSEKVVNRDTEIAGEFAEHLLRQPRPASLREFRTSDLAPFLARPGITAKRQRESATGLKRFVRFLRDTERMDYDAATAALEAI